MLFVLISFALGGQRKHSFQWNMGFSLLCGLSGCKLTIIYTKIFGLVLKQVDVLYPMYKASLIGHV